MKKAKIILGAMASILAIGGAFAFKAKDPQIDCKRLYLTDEGVDGRISGAWCSGHFIDCRMMRRLPVFYFGTHCSFFG